MRTTSWIATVALACGEAAPAPEGWLVGGCALRPERGACVTDGALTVWAERPDGPRATVDGVELPVTAAAVGAGSRWALYDVPAGRLVLTWVDATLGLEVSRTDAWPVGTVEGCAGAVASGQEAWALSRAARGASGAVRARCRAAAREGFAASGWERDASLEALRSAWEALEDGALPGAVLEGLPPVDAAHDAELAYAEAYVRGLAHRERGQVRDARAELGRAAQVAERALPAGWWAAAEAEVADLASITGDHDGALEILAARVARATSPSEDLQARVDLGWALLQADEDGWAARPSDTLAAVGTEARAHLTRAWSLLGDREDGLRADVAVDLALAEVNAGRPDEAVAWLGRVRPEDGFNRTRHWHAEVAARAALASGRAGEAEAIWEGLAADAARAGDLAASWRAWDGLARARLALGRGAAADAAWTEAGRLFLAHAAFVPLHGGREAFLARRVAAAHAQAGLRIERGDPLGAMDVLRDLLRQHAATLRLPERVEALDTGDLAVWEGTLARLADLRASRERLASQLRAIPDDARPASLLELAALEEETAALLDTGLTRLLPELTASLRAPDPGEAIVVVATHGGHWRALARDRARVVSAHVSEGDRGGLWAALAPVIGAAGRVTLLVDDAASRADVHADPALAGKLLVWSVDLPGPRAVPSAGPALVVVDPLRNLPGARAEGEEVIARLAARGVTARTLVGREATRDAVLAGLDGAALWHVAGHGELGLDTWDARLVLADGTSLRLADLLALPQPPALVVLAGCETGTSAGRGTTALGLAQALVLAGSAAVVATTRKVDDAEARAFVGALYEADPLGRSPEVAFRDAVSALRRDRPVADWQALRLIVP